MKVYVVYPYCDHVDSVFVDDLDGAMRRHNELESENGPYGFVEEYEPGKSLGYVQTVARGGLA